MPTSHFNFSFVYTVYSGWLNKPLSVFVLFLEMNVDAQLKRLAEQAFERALRAKANSLQKLVTKRVGSKTGQGKYVRAKKVARPRQVTTAYSGGHIKRGMSVKGKKFRKRYKKQRSIFQRGVFETYEDGGTLISKYNRFIGHASIPRTHAIKALFRALVKSIVNYAGTTIANFEEGAYFNAGDLFILRYRTAVDAPLLNISHAFALGNTYEDIATSLFNAWFVAAGIDSTNVVFESMEINSTTRVIQIPLRNADIEFYFKGSLKIQNRTTETVEDDEADDVNNVPLYGKTYSGPGTGMMIAGGSGTSASTTNLIANIDSGLISLDGDQSWSREPPLPFTLVRAHRMGKVRIEPGKIKTSTLLSKGRMNLTKYYRMVWSTSNTVYPQTFFGKYEIMSLEKIMEAAPSDAGIVPMDIAFEINRRFGAALIVKRTNNTLEIAKVRT